MRRTPVVAFVSAATVLVVHAAGAASNNNFHFVILGDRTGGAEPGVYEQAWREIDELRPDFVINVGDTIEGGSDPHAEAEWEELRPLWKPYGRDRLYFTPGNHDIWSEWSEQIYRERTGRPPFYSFNRQDAHFTVLDNSRTLDLSEEQLAFLEADLKAHRHRRPKFIFVHKPYWILFLKVGSGEFPLHRLARQYGVDYIVSGHGHQLMKMERDGIVYLEVGSTGGKLRQTPGSDGFRHGWFFHIVQVRVNGARAELIVKELDGVDFTGRRFRIDEWGADGPRFNPAGPARRGSLRPAGRTPGEAPVRQGK